MKVPVTKYHGCGNDFIIVNADDMKGIDLERFIPEVCDRHTGIGADGFIIVKTDPLEMVYYNQDGSRAPMCGNGIRCFSAYCLDNKIVSTNEFDVKTLAGIRTVTVKDDGTYEVCMGKPDYDPELIGTPFPISHHQLGEHEISSFFMNTVHTVVYSDDAFGDIEKPGKAICEDPLFASQTNVNFVEVIDPAHLRVQTYERGCGVTLACGTGVCASVVQTLADGLTGNSVDVELKKGMIHIDIRDDIVYMSGPACRILKGEYYYD